MLTLSLQNTDIVADTHSAMSDASLSLYFSRARGPRLIVQHFASQKFLPRASTGQLDMRTRIKIAPNFLATQQKGQAVKFLRNAACLFAVRVTKTLRSQGKMAGLGSTIATDLTVTPTWSYSGIPKSSPG